MDKQWINPDKEMPKDLSWLAQNVWVWEDDNVAGLGPCTHLRKSLSPNGCNIGIFGFGEAKDYQWYTRDQWQHARQQLGLDQQWPDPIMTKEEECAWAEKFGNDVPDADMVNHPPHYQSDNGIECIDAIRAALGKDGFVAYCRGNVIKYSWRMKSNPAEDQGKAAWYASKAKEALEDDDL